MDIKGLKIHFTDNQKLKITEDLKDILDTGQLAAGKYVKMFEDNWSKINNCKFGIAVSSGGAALEVLFRSLGLSGKEVILPTNTFIATYTSAMFAGAKPILADVSYKNMCLDLENIKKNFNSNTGAVCVVHIGGIITDEMEKIKNFCDEKNIYLIEDAAHAHGSTFNGKYSGEFGIGAAYSFFSTKTFTSGEGGMVLTNNEDISKKCFSIRDYGKKSQWESVHNIFSGNFRMSNLTAVIGNNHISEIDNFLNKREKIAKMYTDNLSDKYEKILPKNGKSGWYKYIVYLPKKVNRKDFKDICKNQGLGLSGGVYDKPIHLQPVFDGSFKHGDFPIAEEVCERHICLPIYPSLTEEEVNQTIEILNKSI